MSAGADSLSYAWTVAYYLQWPDERCGVCGFRIQIEEEVDENTETGGVSHVRCRTLPPAGDA